jgi:hypothetical protein
MDPGCLQASRRRRDRRPRGRPSRDAQGSPSHRRRFRPCIRRMGQRSRDDRIDQTSSSSRRPESGVSSPSTRSIFPLALRPGVQPIVADQNAIHGRSMRPSVTPPAGTACGSITCFHRHRLPPATPALRTSHPRPAVALRQRAGRTSACSLQTRITPRPASSASRRPARYTS